MMLKDLGGGDLWGDWVEKIVRRELGEGEVCIEQLDNGDYAYSLKQPKRSLSEFAAILGMTFSDAQMEKLADEIEHIDYSKVVATPRKRQCLDCNDVAGLKVAYGTHECGVCEDGRFGDTCLTCGRGTNG